MDEPGANANSQDSPQLELGGSHHLPPYSIFVHGHGANTQMSFCPQTLKWGLIIPKIGTSTILESHNFVCRLLIEVKSKANL